MRDAQHITDTLRRQGLRVTSTRRAVIESLAAREDHPTVAAIHEAALSMAPTISLKTVYQTLHELKYLGELRLVGIDPGSMRVDPNVEEDHHHFVCSTCGVIRDIGLDIDPHFTEVAELGAAHVERVEVVLRGTCDHCAS